MPGADIPYAELEALFLDAGNTLVSIDFAWVRDELAELGFDCAVDDLRRAEAAARPVVSRWVSENRSTEGASSFAFYLASILGGFSGRVGLLAGRHRSNARSGIRGTTPLALRSSGLMI